MSPKNYGRQAKGKTIKSISIESDLADWIEAQAKEKGQNFSAFINEFFKELSENERSQNITPLPKQKVNTMAAAGPGIMAEVLDFTPGDRVLNVKVVGDSMSPLLDDGVICSMAPFSLSRSPFMKKGLIYLVELNGEKFIKRYDTRKPNEDEKDADYLTKHGSVGLLVSENPDYEDIIVTDPELKWEAWADKQGKYPEIL